MKCVWAFVLLRPPLKTFSPKLKAHFYDFYEHSRARDFHTKRRTKFKVLLFGHFYSHMYDVIVYLHSYALWNIVVRVDVVFATTILCAVAINSTRAIVCFVCVCLSLSYVTCCARIVRK